MFPPLVFGGTPARLLQLADLGAFQIVISETIKAELGRKPSTSKFGWSAGRVAAATEELWRNSRFITPEHPLKVSRDPDDDHFLPAPSKLTLNSSSPATTICSAFIPFRA